MATSEIGFGYDGFASGRVQYLFNACSQMNSKCALSWAKNLGKIGLGAVGMFGGGAICTSGVGCALGSVGIVTGAANVYEGAEWISNGDEVTDGRNPIKQAIKAFSPSANADLAFASLEVLGAGLALKAPITLYNELWVTSYGIQKIPSLPVTRPASTLPSGMLDGAGAAWDGSNAALDQTKKR